MKNLSSYKTSKETRPQNYSVVPIETSGGTMFEFTKEDDSYYANVGMIKKYLGKIDHTPCGCNALDFNDNGFCKYCGGV